MTSGAASVLASNQEQTGALSDNATSNSVIHSTSGESELCLQSYPHACV